MKMYMYNNGELVAYLFSKKRFIKVLNSLGISNWKKFLKTYNSDDTEQIVFAFADRNWKYKKIVFSKSSVS